MMLTKLIFSWLGPFLGLMLVRILPKKRAYQVGEWIVQALVKQHDSGLYRAVRGNQAVVRDWAYEDERLHAVVLEVLLNAAYGLVDWFHALAFPSKLDDLPCSVEDDVVADANRSLEEGYGVFLVGAHLSNINMFFMLIAQREWPIQILSYHEEQGSHLSDNIFRRKFGLNVTPISASSLRQAFRRLKSGGCVLTGVDRPDTGGEVLSFFGRPTKLPIGHARLALRTGARMIVMAVQNAKQRSYHVVGSSLIEADHSDDDQLDARKLAQQVLDQLEKFIRERPAEWMMFIPVWPEELPERRSVH